MTRRLLPLRPPEAHVVVVGAGGIGCPAAWALAEAGVGRLKIVDPDAVELSNLPRQVLYGPDDVGRPKATVAAERLRHFSGRVSGVVERMDHLHEDVLLADADLLVDATDGALTKDWLNALAVRRRLPLVHAAGLRSEGRILDVPAGGRPCLACLFGRLEVESGTCADLGVWGGVVGAIGFLAARFALWRLEHPEAASRGYLVLDLEGGRAVTLGAEASPNCPVCGPPSPADAEPYPMPESCVVPSAGPAGRSVLDLTDEVCPMNLLRARQAVEALPAGALLEIRLGTEGRDSVPDGLRALGHDVSSEEPTAGGLRLQVRRRDREREGGPRLGRDELLRFSRQVVLPEVGEVGQQALLEARAVLMGQGPAFETAARYLRAAGLERLRLNDDEMPDPVSVDAAMCGVTAPRDVVIEAAPEAGGVRLDLVPEPRGIHNLPTLRLVDAIAQRAIGAILADAVCRAIVLGRTDVPDLVVYPDGTIAPSSRTA